MAAREHPAVSGLQDKTIHLIAILHALSAGMNLTIIQQLLGHTDPKTTLIYAEINPTWVQYEYNRIIT